MALVTMREINGEEYEVHAGKYGRWSIHQQTEDDTVGSSLGEGDTLDKAVANARIQINKNKVKLNIPFITIAGERGVATGRHGRTRQVLATIEGEKTTANSSNYLRGDMPQDEIDRLIDVQTRIGKLNAELREIINEYRFDLNAEVTRQISENAQA